MNSKNSLIIAACLIIANIVFLFAGTFSPLIPNHEDYYTNSHITYAEAEWNHVASYATANHFGDVKSNSSNDQSIRGGAADWWIEKSVDLMPGTYRMSALVRYRDLIESPIGINKWYTYSFNGTNITMRTNPETGADWELAGSEQGVNFSWHIADDVIEVGPDGGTFKFLSAYQHAHIDMFRFERINVPETIIQIDETDPSVTRYAGSNFSGDGAIGGSVYIVKDGHVSITPDLEESKYYLRVRMRAGSYANMADFDDIEVSIDGTPISMQEETFGALWAFDQNILNFVWWHSVEPVTLSTASTITVADDDGYWNFVDAFEFIMPEDKGTLILLH